MKDKEIEDNPNVKSYQDSWLEKSAASFDYSESEFYESDLVQVSEEAEPILHLSFDSILNPITQVLNPEVLLKKKEKWRHFDKSLPYREVSRRRTNKKNKAGPLPELPESLLRHL
jgi:hypothetical protein